MKYVVYCVGKNISNAQMQILKMNSKTMYTIIVIVIALYISFPFFNIKYFEIHSSIIIIKNYLLLPIMLLAFISMSIVYYKFLRKLNPPTNSKAKKNAQDFFTILLGGIAGSGVLIGITLSTIITTNAYIGTSKNIEIKAEVLNYSTSRSKYGRVSHLIAFVNPYDGKTIKLEVYKKYNIGDIFSKKMKIGYWNQLYSKN